MAAIDQIVPSLDSNTRDIAREAQSAARALIRSLAAIEDEIARLSGDVDPDEIRQVREKLATLGTATDGESADRGELRHSRRDDWTSLSVWKGV